MTQHNQFDPEWISATLNDAKEELENLITEIENHPDEAQLLLESEIAKVYAKLNYAYNSAELGPEALVTFDDDDLVSFPAILPFKHSPMEVENIN